MSNNQGNNWGLGSVKCGPLVEAIVCPQGSIEVKGGQDNGFQCEGGDLGQHIGSRESNDSVQLEWNTSTLILEHHPWVAKGDGYLGLGRQTKAQIIRDKVNADDEIGPNNGHTFFAIDLNEVFDTKGDELDCRYKSSHSQGNVGEIEWISTGDHEYTGLF